MSIKDFAEVRVFITPPTAFSYTHKNLHFSFSIRGDSYLYPSASSNASPASIQASSVSQLQSHWVKSVCITHAAGTITVPQFPKKDGLKKDLKMAFY